MGGSQPQLAKRTDFFESCLVFDLSVSDFQITKKTLVGDFPSNPITYHIYVVLPHCGNVQTTKLGGSSILSSFLCDLNYFMGLSRCFQWKSVIMLRNRDGDQHQLSGRRNLRLRQGKAAQVLD